MKKEICYRLKSGAGFTLVEVLIVMAVISVLASSLIALINPVTQLRKARDATRKSDLSQIRSALELYRSDIGNYPLQDDITDPPDGAIKCSNVALTGGTPPNTYMKKVPCDPLPSGPYLKYFYSYDDAVDPSYKLWACLENINDKERDGVDGAVEDICGEIGRVSYTLQNP